MRIVGLLFISIAPVFAGEFAVLSNGARLHVDRHVTDGDKVRLYNPEGYIELAGALIAGFESDVQPAPATAETASVANRQPELTAGQLADAAADRYGLPRSLVRSVMGAESNYHNDATSPKGAIGLMQLMPGTAQTLHADPYNAAQNADAGARYLRDLLVKYDGKLWHALAAYNAGPGAVDKYKGVPPYRETVNYVRRIDEKYKRALNDKSQPADSSVENAHK